MLELPSATRTHTPGYPQAIAAAPSAPRHHRWCPPPSQSGQLVPVQVWFTKLLAVPISSHDKLSIYDKMAKLTRQTGEN